jgi:hypothetical protein
VSIAACHGTSRAASGPRGEPPPRDVEEARGIARRAVARAPEAEPEVARSAGLDPQRRRDLEHGVRSAVDAMARDAARAGEPFEDERRRRADQVARSVACRPRVAR